MSYVAYGSGFVFLPFRDLSVLKAYKGMERVGKIEEKRSLEERIEGGEQSEIGKERKNGGGFETTRKRKEELEEEREESERVWVGERDES